MECVISFENLKDFGKALNCLSRVGDNVCFESYVDRLVIYTVSSSLSVLAKFTFMNGFFSTISADGPNRGVCIIRCKILTKSIQPIVRTLILGDKTIESCAIRFMLGEPCLVFELGCTHGITRLYKLNYEDVDELKMVSYKAQSKSTVSIKASIMNECISNFPASLEEISFVFDHQRLRVKSYIDGEENISRIKNNANRMLATEFALSRSEFTLYQVAKSATLTFCLKEVRAILQYCDAYRQALTIYFDSGGSPLTLAYEDVNYVQTDFVLSTLLDPNEEEEEDCQSPNETRIDATILCNDSSLLAGGNSPLLSDKIQNHGQKRGDNVTDDAVRVNSNLDPYNDSGAPVTHASPTNRVHVYDDGRQKDSSVPELARRDESCNMNIRGTAYIKGIVVGRHDGVDICGSEGTNAVREIQRELRPTQEREIENTSGIHYTNNNRYNDARPYACVPEYTHRHKSASGERIVEGGTTLHIQDEGGRMETPSSISVQTTSVNVLEGKGSWRNRLATTKENPSFSSPKTAHTHASLMETHLHIGEHMQGHTYEHERTYAYPNVESEHTSNIQSVSRPRTGPTSASSTDTGRFTTPPFPTLGPNIESGRHPNIDVRENSNTSENNDISTREGSSHTGKGVDGNNEHGQHALSQIDTHRMSSTTSSESNLIRRSMKESQRPFESHVSNLSTITMNTSEGGPGLVRDRGGSQSSELSVSLLNVPSDYDSANAANRINVNSNTTGSGSMNGDGKYICSPILSRGQEDVIVKTYVNSTPNIHEADVGNHAHEVGGIGVGLVGVSKGAGTSLHTTLGIDVCERDRLYEERVAETPPGSPGIERQLKKTKFGVKQKGFKVRTLDRNPSDV
eukprot:CFRG3442T1